MTMFASLIASAKDTAAWLWFPFGTIMHLLAFLLVTIHCLKNRREATSTLLWIFISWSFPIIGPLAFVSFGINRVPTKGWHKQKSDQKFLTERRAREDGAMPLAYWRAVHESLATQPSSGFMTELNNTMDAILQEYPLLGGNSIKPLVTGDEAFPEMLQAIRNAEHHIHLQAFIIEDDAVGHEFLELMKEKAESGVMVRFLYDRFGSTQAWISGLMREYEKVPNMHLVGWTQANPIKRQFQINLRNHRKLMIVDGKNAFAGGINLCSDNISMEGQAPVRDYHFAIRGPIVQELQYSFLRDWYFMTDEDPDLLLNEKHFPHISPTGNALVRVINGGPTSEIETITDTLFVSICSAKHQLLAVTPYLVPTQDIMRAFRAAALRGVDVRIVVPLKNNHFYAGMAGRALYDDLLTAGVRIFERNPPFIHAKAMIIDDALAIVGTANLDVRSLRLNYETNLAIFDDQFANELKRIVLEDIAMSKELELVTWRARPMIKRLQENFCNLLTPIL